MNQLAPVEDKNKRQLIEVSDPIPVLDTSRFEHMQRIASVMAQSTLIPESLYMQGDKNNRAELPLQQIVSNCFLVVNQAVRWGLDPFAVAQSVAVVHGKLCYEGKLVAAILDAKIGVRLHHHFTGAPGNDDYRIYLADREFDAATIAELTPGFRKSGWRIIDGSVGEWKTTGTNSPWSPKNQPRMLVYRGTRDWTRIYEPAIMLGVYTPDELLDLAENARANRAREIPSVMQRLQDARSAAPDAEPEGFSRSFVTSETSALSGGPEIEQEPETSASPADAAAAEQPSPEPTVAADHLPAADAADLTGAGGTQAREEPVAPSAPATPTDADRDWLLSAARQVWAGTGKGEQDLVVSISADLKKTVPAEIGKLTRDRFNSIVKHCKSVCFGETAAGEALEIIAGIVGVEPKEIVATQEGGAS